VSVDLRDNKTLLAPLWYTIILIVYILVPLSLFPFGAHLVSFVRRSTWPVTYAVNFFSHWIVFGLAIIGLSFKHRRLGDLISEPSPPGTHWTKNVATALLFWLFLIVLTVFFVVLFGDFSGEDYFVLPKTPLQLLAFTPLALTAGFCEEVVFRGYLLKQFDRLTSNRTVAITGQAIIFSLVHGYHQTVVGFIHKFCFGLAFGALALWRKSLLPGIVAHILLDLSAAITAFLT